jgi:hypothetical protein
LGIGQRLCQAALCAEAKDQHAFEFPGHHVGSGTRGWFVVPARDGGPAGLQLGAHHQLDEPPEEQGDQQDQAERFDALRAFEKQGVDDPIIPEEAEVFLDPVLLFVGTQDLLGAVAIGALLGNVGEQYEAAGQLAEGSDRTPLPLGREERISPS